MFLPISAVCPQSFQARYRIAWHGHVEPTAGGRSQDLPEQPTRFARLFSFRVNLDRMYV